MPKIYAPNKEYTGISAGVPFVNGVGEASDSHIIEWFKRSGYEVEEQEEQVEEPPKPEPEPEVSEPDPEPEPEPKVSEPEPAPAPKKTSKKTGN